MSKRPNARNERFRKEIQPAALDVATKLAQDHLEAIFDRAILFSDDDHVIALTLVSTMLPITVYSCAVYVAQLIEAFIPSEHIEAARKENERVLIEMVSQGLSEGLRLYRESNP